LQSEALRVRGKLGEVGRREEVAFFYTTFDFKNSSKAGRPGCLFSFSKILEK
jgi:hypothetical protein